jgi:hypothetical protein
MSQSNIITSPNENLSPSISSKKPLAFVQPVIRDSHSVSNSPQRRKLPMNFNYNEK